MEAGTPTNTSKGGMRVHWPIRPPASDNIWNTIHGHNKDFLFNIDTTWIPSSSKHWVNFFPCISDSIALSFLLRTALLYAIIQMMDRTSILLARGLQILECGLLRLMISLLAYLEAASTWNANHILFPLDMVKFLKGTLNVVTNLFKYGSYLSHDVIPLIVPSFPPKTKILSPLTTAAKSACTRFNRETILVFPIFKFTFRTV